MGSSPMETLRNYFEARNLAWTTGDIKAAARAAGVARDTSWWRRNASAIRARRQLADWRRSRIVRAHTKIKADTFVDGSDAKTMAITEEITWVYADGADFGVESRVVRHLQEWKRTGDAWILVSDKATDESLGDPVSNWEVPEEPGAPLERDRLPVVDGLRACSTYDRLRAIRYAELWWNGANPNFQRFDSDCTNFISQCLWSGNMRMVGGQDRASGWWYQFRGHGQDDWSYSWTTAQALCTFLRQRAGAKVIKRARDLKLGDVIFYDWEGSGKFGHSTIVVDFDNHGDPLVNAHTADSYHRHYLYLDSPAWTQRTQYLFVHLSDEICL